MSEKACPLCQTCSTRNLDTTPHPGGSYRHCADCDLIFATPGGILAPDEEKSRYLLHDNSHANEGYVDMLTAFLDKAVLAFADRGTALDFGSGPGPVLADLMTERGFAVKTYDPFFSFCPQVLREKFDVVTATEVMEHVTAAHSAWTNLVACLNPGGILAVMTHLHPGLASFDGWWYHRDPTHIRFYSHKTLSFISRRYRAPICWSDGKKTATFRRPPEPG